MFYVYVLHSRFDNGSYIGYSTDLKNRLKQHKTRLLLRNIVPRSLDAHLL